MTQRIDSKPANGRVTDGTYCLTVASGQKANRNWVRRAAGDEDAVAAVAANDIPRQDVIGAVDPDAHSGVGQGDRTARLCRSDS